MRYAISWDDDGGGEDHKNRRMGNDSRYTWWAGLETHHVADINSSEG